MIRFTILTLVSLLSCVALFSLQLVDSQGFSREFDNAKLHKHETQEVKTSREKDGVVRLNNWEGFRFDLWLQQQNPGSYRNIRFESSDRYQVSLSRSEFEALESYLVIAQDGIKFENNSLRLIFPSLREMQWIRDLQRIILEDFEPLPRPDTFYLTNSFLAKHTLYDEPQPFVNIKGWFLKDLLSAMSEMETKQVILFSRDGLKQNLSYPLHLEGAVLEKTELGGINLKSPQIPGGMWVKDIIYLQCDSQAIIEPASLNRLIELSKVLGWEASHNMEFHIMLPTGEEVYPFTDALAEPQVFEGALYFKLF